MNVVFFGKSSPELFEIFRKYSAKLPEIIHNTEKKEK